MAPLLGEIRSLNGFGGRAIAEPFAGGAGASLALLYQEETHEIYVNDADPAIHDFWWSLVNRPKLFMRMLASVRVNMAEWRRQRDVYRKCRRLSRLRRGFSVFYLNRCNHSGIVVNGGPIGGIKQLGRWKLNARFNKSELQRRCEIVTEFRDRVRVSCQDGIEFIRNLNAESTFFFIDPPYYVKGKTLYLNSLDKKYHQSLADQLKSIENGAWVLTYDDCPEIREMYRSWAIIRPFSLRYSAADRRSGKELLITPKWIRTPSSHVSAAITW